MAECRDRACELLHRLEFKDMESQGIAAGRTCQMTSLGDEPQAARLGVHSQAYFASYRPGHLSSSRLRNPYLRRFWNSQSVNQTNN